MKGGIRVGSIVVLLRLVSGLGHDQHFDEKNNPKIMILGVQLPFPFSSNQRAEGTSNCVCVPRRLCDSNFNVIQGGEGIIVERLMTDPPNGTCANPYYICCRLKDPAGLQLAESTTTEASTVAETTTEIVTTTPTTTPTTTEETTPEVTTPEATTPEATTLEATTPEAASETSTTQSTSNSAAYQCGKNFAQPTELSTDPYTTEFAEFPWMLALLDYTALNPDGRLIRNGFICGASLLTKDIAMTAAHCIKGRPPSSLFIRAGDWDSMYANESIPHQDRSLSKIEIHPKFDNITLYNDIALLKLNSPVIFANNVIPICLPTAEDKFIGQSCIATGWGQNAFGPNGRFATKMRKISLPILEKDVCQDMLRKTRLAEYFKLHESFICAGGLENLDTCTGDGGGPLVCKNNDTNTYTQAGIVSWGIGCGEKDIPGVYSDVVKLKSWIDSTVDCLSKEQYGNS